MLEKLMDFLESIANELSGGTYLDEIYLESSSTLDTRWWHLNHRMNSDCLDMSKGIRTENQH